MVHKIFPKDHRNQVQQFTHQQQKAQRNFAEPPTGYKQPKYPRDNLKDKQDDADLGGSYQQCLYKCGDCLGSVRACCPCFCCVDYPYRTVDQSFVGVYERFGMYIRTVNPGLIYVNPCTDNITIVDQKTLVIDLNRQSILTRDNIIVNVDAAVYYRIFDAKSSVYMVTNIYQAVTQLAYATLRSIIGQYTLQNVLEKRQEIAEEFQNFVDIYSWEWGVDVEKVVLKDIQLNQDLQQSLSVVAQEQRAAQAKILNAQADVESAKMMREAAGYLDSKSAMQIRYLETITTLGQQNSTKVVFLPNEEK